MHEETNFRPMLKFSNTIYFIQVLNYPFNPSLLSLPIIINSAIPSQIDFSSYLPYMHIPPRFYTVAKEINGSRKEERSKLICTMRCLLRLRWALDLAGAGVPYG
jgi:hypothetical protein